MRYRLRSDVLAIDANGTLRHLPAGSMLQIVDQGETGLISVCCEGETFRSFLSDLQDRAELDEPGRSCGQPYGSADLWTSSFSEK
jgi:hypothetical protein